MISRTPFYSLALLTAVLQSVFGTLAGFVNGRSPLLYIFGKLAGGLSLATWIWIAVLLHFNSRPQSSHPLSRSYAHFISFVFFAVVWLAIGIMLSTQMPYECAPSGTSFIESTGNESKGANGDGTNGTEHTVQWCAAASFSSALAFCTSFLCLPPALIIHSTSSASGAGLAVNVAQADGEELMSGVCKRELGVV